MVPAMARKLSDQIKRFSLRLPASLLAHLQHAATSRGWSANDEIVDRLGQGRMADALFRGTLNIQELASLTDWAEMIQAACLRGGVDPGSWQHYAPLVPFAAGLSAETIFATVAAEVAKDIEAALEVLGGARSQATLERKVRHPKNEREKEAAEFLMMISRNRIALSEER